MRRSNRSSEGGQDAWPIAIFPCLKRFRAKWTPARVKKTRQNKNPEPRFDSIETGKALVSRRQVSHREFDLTVRKLPPILDNRQVSGLRTLIKDFTSFQTRRINRQREYPGPPIVRHPVC
jgi:hypothetical protein